MRKISSREQDILWRIRAFSEGSYVPADGYGMDPFLKDILHSLVKKGRLKADEIDGAPRYELTEQGRIDAA